MFWICICLKANFNIAKSFSVQSNTKVLFPYWYTWRHFCFAICNDGWIVFYNWQVLLSSVNLLVQRESQGKLGPRQSPGGPQVVPRESPEEPKVVSRWSPRGPQAVPRPSLSGPQVVPRRFPGNPQLVLRRSLGGQRSIKFSEACMTRYSFQSIF